MTAEHKRRDESNARLDDAIKALNDFDEKYGSFADEFSDLCGAVRRPPKSGTTY